ncbi:MAG: hypothetical protein HFE94_03840 [Acutalibacter sp.]|nr:hypothetical protein [Acutalibacter sp.]
MAEQVKEQKISKNWLIAGILILLTLVLALAPAAWQWHKAKSWEEALLQVAGSEAAVLWKDYYISDYQEFCRQDPASFAGMLSDKGREVRDKLDYLRENGGPSHEGPGLVLTLYTNLAVHRMERGDSPELEAAFRELRPGLALLFDWDTAETYALLQDLGPLEERLEAVEDLTMD